MRFFPLALSSFTLAFGCGGDPAPAPAPESRTRPDPTPYEPGFATEQSASLDAATAGALVPWMIDWARVLDPNAMRAAYEALFAHGDADCPAAEVIPSSDGQEVNTLWGNDCVSADGTRFKGNMQLSEYARVLDDGSTDEGFSLGSNGSAFEITAADGSFVKGATFVSSSTLSFDGYTQHLLVFQGDFAADESNAAGNPWLTGESGGTLQALAIDIDGARNITYNATFRTPGYTSLSAVTLGNLSVDRNGCDLRTLGVVAVRDQAGAWHDALFGLGEDDDGCDACADFAFGIEPLGSFCTDPAQFEGMLAWETAPW